MSKIIIINCQFSTLDKNFFSRAEMCLSPPEKRIFNTLQKMRRQQQYLAGHYLLRFGLTQLLGETDYFWDIAQEVGAAPILLNSPENQQAYLSISHSRDQLICVVSINNPVGIDIENHCRDRPFIEFSEQYLSDQELFKLRALQETERKSYFYALWTVMESVAKAQGQGLDQKIFDGSWHTELDSAREDCSLNKSSYFTYTAGLKDYTITIATKRTLTEFPLISQFNEGAIHEIDIDFSRGCFLLDKA